MDQENTINHLFIENLVCARLSANNLTWMLYLDFHNPSLTFEETGT